MKEQLQLRLTPEVAYTPLRVAAEVSTRMGVDINRITHIEPIKRSIDARQRQVMVNLTVDIYIDEQPPEQPQPAIRITYPDVTGATDEAIVVGAGPAGLFAALKLIEGGVRPIVLERGKDVDSRRKDLARISRDNVVDPDSNYCFGEGGAGAYSDGKLYTRSKKRGSVDRILSVFYQHGAPSDILVDAHPHIGTDKLPLVIKAMRETIKQSGGKVLFSTKVVDVMLDDNATVTGVIDASGHKYHGPVILATGHSARDVYRMLNDRGIDLQPKGIAVGVRLEHPQQLIDRLQYHSAAGRGKYLPPAEYSMLTRVDGRGVYSFCMCPGGFIIPAASEPGQSVVNGMSPSNRGTRWANSGMVVEVLPEDLVVYDQWGVLKMMKFQEDIETRFNNAAGGTQKAPAQRMTDFVEGRLSKSLPETSYAPGLFPARVDQLLPEIVADRLRKAFREFGRKQKGFLTAEATVVGDETRTSSPVRIPRDAESMMHVAFTGLFPTGEGAGYAGGIVSAAMDGENAAEAVCRWLSASKHNI